MAADFDIGYRRVYTSGMDKPHLHNHYELFLCLSDAVRCLINDQLYVIGSKTLVLFGYNCLHKVVPQPDKPYERYVISFKRDFLEDFSTECAPLLNCFQNGFNVIPLQEHRFKRILNIYKSLHTQKQKKQAFHQLKSKLLLTELLINLQEQSESPPAPEPEGGDIGAVLSYIAANCQGKVCIDDLCRIFYISRSTLTSRFKASTGTTVNSYITGLRLSRAIDMLANGYSITAVCGQCGFPDQTHFTRVFTNRFGCPPGRYARQCKNGYYQPQNKRTE